MCERPCRTHHTGAACRDPACPHTGGRHTPGRSCSGHPCNACRRARSSLDTGVGVTLGRASQTTEKQEPPPHAQCGRRRRAESELTSHRVFHHRAPLAWALNLKNFIHEDDPTVVERIIPVREKPLEHSSWPALLGPSERTWSPSTSPDHISSSNDIK